MKQYSAHETDRMQELDGAQLASFSRRFGAIFIDMILLCIVFLLVTSAISPVLTSHGWIDKDTEIAFAIGLNWYSTAFVLAYFGLATYLGNGRTPGKWLFAIRAVSLIHRRMGLWHSFERALGYGASVLECGFGFIQYFIEPNGRTVHDRIAGTIVVREARWQRKTIRLPAPSTDNERTAL